ncbi:hypothetical protein MKW98_031242 [Papaver atlanticum]|uniref:FBD domain-containing protein n=1 Tax=Papaver atlanticum TaxID=357466 RepID=A0AAD4S4Z6_9MAGN|nr:hypothetical protein MKW98_031242 [Papaver atlanticum]
MSTSFTLKNLSSLNFMPKVFMKFFRGLHKVKLLKLRPYFIKPLYLHNDPQLYPCCDEVKFNPENIGDYWDAGLSMSCMICHLKYLEIKGLLGRVDELKFLEILLKHATVLEKVVLSRRMRKFSEILLTFPTASKEILILFKF